MPLRYRITLTCIVVLGCTLALAAQGTKNARGWRELFDVDKANLASTGRNTYFILEPGYTLHLAHGKEVLVVSVLDETKLVDGVVTRVVEERETKEGQPVEVSRNYFAIDRTTEDVYYFGEDVDMYKNGKITSHEGSWLSGVNGARFGLMRPGKPAVGDKYYQENAPGVARDRAEILTVTGECKLPAGTFKNCLQTRDSSAPEIGDEAKWYAPGVGLVKDSDFKLVKKAP